MFVLVLTNIQQSINNKLLSTEKNKMTHLICSQEQNKHYSTLQKHKVTNKNNCTYGSPTQLAWCCVSPHHPKDLPCSWGSLLLSSVTLTIGTQRTEKKCIWEEPHGKFPSFNSLMYEVHSRNILAVEYSCSLPPDIKVHFSVKESPKDNKVKAWTLARSI